VDAAELAGLDFCYVTTTGRRSGRPHTIEIWFALEGNVAYLLAGGGQTSDWVRNLREHPTVGLRLGDREMLCRARVVDDPEEDRRARTLVYGKYSPSNAGLDDWRESALPVAVELPENEPSGTQPRQIAPPEIAPTD
jgi:deazaflavin-dependent oxidoreductase (nitroreductase family)